MGELLRDLAIFIIDSIDIGIAESVAKPFANVMAAIAPPRRAGPCMRVARLVCADKNFECAFHVFLARIAVSTIRAQSSTAFDLSPKSRANARAMSAGIFLPEKRPEV